MDNDLQKNENIDDSSQPVEVENPEDIQFEDVFDIDKIQKELNNDFSEPEVKTPDFDVMSQLEKTLSEAIAESPIAQKMPIVSHHDPNSKKYVIYVDAENIDYIENLSVNERKNVINKVLSEQKQLSEKEKESRQRRRFLSHLFLALLTFMICFPLMFIRVNKAAKITIENYSNARGNISKLYKEQGKIKMK